jgi:two-component system osmolarity sensor histidine kinase EnvZ
VKDGDLSASHLSESVATREIREVNIGFNRMAQQLSKVAQDRAFMLAGISHDLRTPLARLRLETELSVADLDAREHMAADIEQVDAIIDKFLDYARPDHIALVPVRLNDVIDACVYAVKDHADLQVTLDVAPHLIVLADETELGRVIANLLENARRYGKSAVSGVATVDITARRRAAGDKGIELELRDHGPGVPPDILGKLTQPFFRGDEARTAATGSGLGLSIVEKAIERMGGTFALVNARGGGLAARMELKS